MGSLDVPAAFVGDLSGLKLPRLNDRLSTTIILLLMAVLTSSSGLLSRADNLLFDLGQKSHIRQVPGDIVIVAIDEESLSRLGRWPWPRQFHAEAIDRLKADGAKVIGLDIMFSEPDTRNLSADAALGAAIRHAGNVVLPVLLENSRVNGQLVETLPMPFLAENAAAMGRAHAELDDDGIARGIFLHEGVGGAVWPHFADAVLQVAGEMPVDTSIHASVKEAREQPWVIVRYDPRRINYLGPPGWVPSISYHQIISGDFPAGMFRGKIVLVGATAAGMGDMLPTPVSGHRQLMPGIEFHANVIEAMRTGGLIRPLPLPVSASLCALLAIVPMLWLPRSGPRNGLLVSILWLFVVAFAAILLPWFSGYWLAPAGALLAIFFAYPVWSWRRLEHAGYFLDRELDQLHHDLASEGAKWQQEVTSFPKDVLERRMSQIQAVSAHLRRLHEERRETLAFISHDLRAPLAAAIMKVDEIGGEAAGRLRPPLEHALSLAEAFLQVSRAEMAHSQDFQEMDLGAAIHQAIDDVYAFARKKSVRLVRQVPDEPVWVNGDFGLLHRAVLNLVLNAVKFSPEKSDVVISCGMDTGNTVSVSVLDVGAGIGEAQQKIVFERFHRRDRRPLDGAGLGLYFVKVVAQRHGGSVEVSSQPGKGSCFTFRLPILHG